MDFLEQSENNTALFNRNKVFLIGKYKLTCIKKLAISKKNGDLYLCILCIYVVMSVRLWNFEDGGQLFAQESTCSKETVVF